MPSTQDIEAFLNEKLAAQASATGRALPKVTPDLNLLESGLYDSLGFMELLTSIENELGVAVDLSDVDPERFTTYGGLSAVIAGAAGAG